MTALILSTQQQANVVRYVSQRAGIGINAGRIRRLVLKSVMVKRSTLAVSPFYKYFQTAVKCCSQGGVRGGAAAVFYPLWHGEVQSLLKR